MVKRFQSRDDGRSRGASLFIVIGLVALIWLVFGRTLSHGFINYDDHVYVYENAEVSAGLTAHGLSWAFTHPVSHNWHPITVLSHMLDCQLYGLKPAGHHFTNVLLHATAAVLLFFVLKGFTGSVWRSAFVAAIFSIHPLRVESVAWVAERKDVLAGVFFMLTLGAYLRYVRRPSPLNLFVVALIFAPGLMCKSMLVTIPFVLLLLDFWPLHRLKQLRSLPGLILEKIPLFGIAAAGVLVTLISQQGAIRSSDELPFSTRAGNAVMAVMSYLGQTVWPVRMAPFYPHPKDGIPLGETLLFVLLLLFATIAVIAFAAKRPRHGYLATGWLWYVGMLVPVLGIIQVGLQARADRYTYLPQIGLFMATTWGIAELSTSWPARRQILSVLALSLIAILSWCARIQASYWHDSVSLWRHALAVTGENALAETSLADALIARGEIDEAIAHAQSAVRLQPDSPDAQNNLGIALSRKGNLREAIAHLQQAAGRSPDRPKIHYNLATILLQNGEIDEAIAQYRLELRTQPRSAEAHNNLGIALSQKGDIREAITEWRRTLQTQPENLDAHCNLAWVFSTYPEASIRNGQEAVELAQRALKLSGGKNPRIFRLLAAGYAEMGKFPEAVDAANRGLQLAIEQGNAHLANVLRENINQFRANSPLRDRGK